MLDALKSRLLPAQWRRDLEMIVRGFVGEPISPFVARPSSQTPAQEASHRARKLVVAEVRKETPDAVSLVLRDPTGAPIAFEAGQFFTLSRRIGDDTHKRAYSASSSALEKGSVSVTVKRVSGGLVSNDLNDRAQVGDTLSVLGPSGSFTVPSWINDVVLVGGGSGITPLMSIARTLLASKASARVLLVFGNRSEDDVIFAREIDELAREHAERFSVRHVLEREPTRRSARVGRLDEEVLREELLGPAGRPASMFFICGPEPVMAAAERVLASLGVEPERVKTERFATVRAATGATEPEEVVVVNGNTREHLTVAPGETILEAATRSRIELPFSCTVGGCGACRVRLVSGDVALDQPNCLHADERREGYVLTCVSRPLGPVTIEVE
jgi:ferredoxin-NADP reductase